MSRFWHHFVSNGRGGRACGRLGIRGHEVPLWGTAIRRHGLTQQTGVEVWQIDHGSPAEKAGILDDDILLRLAGQPVTEMEQLAKLVRQLRGMVPIELLRGEVYLERWITLGGWEKSDSVS